MNNYFVKSIFEKDLNINLIIYHFINIHNFIIYKNIFYYI
jgi:hypothetical protein